MLKAPDVLERWLEIDIQDLGAGMSSLETVWVAPAGGAFISGRITVIFREATVGVNPGNDLSVLVQATGIVGAISEAIVSANQAAGARFVAQNYNVALARLPAGQGLDLGLSQIGTANGGRAVVLIPWRPLTD